MPQSRHRRRVARRRPPECARLARFTRRSWDSSVSFAPTGHGAGCASRLRSVAAGSGSFGLRQRLGFARVAAIATPVSRDLARRNLMPSLGRARAQSTPLGRHTSPKFWERDAVSLPDPRNFHQPILCRAASESAGRARAAANAVIDEKPAPCAMLGLGQSHRPLRGRAFPGGEPATPISPVTWAPSFRSWPQCDRNTAPTVCPAASGPSWAAAHGRRPITRRWRWHIRWQGSQPAAGELPSSAVPIVPASSTRS